MGRGVRRWPCLVAVVLALVFAACEKPDASQTTSPSAKSLLGTTSGEVTYGAEGQPPASREEPGWEFELGNARFSKLENGQASIQVVTQLEAQAGPEMEIWLSGPEGNLLHWSAGPVRPYNGVVCFQLRLEDDTRALPLVPGEPYRMTIAFREGEEVLVSQSANVAGRAPALHKPAPDAASSVGRELLGCPRSVI